VLNSPREKVVADAIEEIRWHVRFLDLLGADGSGKIVLHVGGAFGDKDAALDRFAGVVAGLPESWRRRLIIENDEHVFSIEEVLGLSRRTGLPVVFDNLHDRIRSGRDDGPSRFLPACFATWGEADGPPKVHFSSQAPGGRPGQHADWIEPDEFAQFLRSAPARTFDSMLECKKKDLALFRLREELEIRGLVETGEAVV
jgi:UV DNA damage endonuclease